MGPQPEPVLAKAGAGVTGKVEKNLSTKTIVMPAEAGIPFVCFRLFTPLEKLFSKLIQFDYIIFPPLK